jgi:N-acetylmuramoyl-L-alanine amidase
MNKNTRRTLLKSAPLLSFSVWSLRAQAASILDVRLWPAQDYTRVSIELDHAPKYQHFQVATPERVVVDLEGLSLDAPLRNLVSRIQANDPYIASVRVGQPSPNVVASFCANPDWYLQTSTAD